MATPTVEAVLSASSWADLGLPRTRASLRTAARAVHPDLCSDPRAGRAFARLNDLFAAPEHALRVATAQRAGPGVLRWTPRSSFDDLADVARQAMADVAATTPGAAPRFATWTLPGPGVTVAYAQAGADEPGQRWWFLRDFPRLDSRTGVWVAKRLAAAVAAAERAGWVHGDIHPATVVLDPAGHGLRLDGWWSAVRLDERIAVAPTAPTPPRWLGGAAADATMSVAQAAAMLVERCAADEPLRTVLARHAVDPGTPVQLHDDVDRAARALYGAPSWHVLADPASAPI